MNDQELRDLLALDGLSEAEKLTGQSYKTDKETMAVGMALFLDLNRQKTEALVSAGDSHYSQSLLDHLLLLQNLGFEIVLCDSFLGNEGPEETIRVLWHPKGILSVVESWSGHHLNTSRIYYNVLVHEKRSFREFTSSGRLIDDTVWCGDHDGRIGLRLSISGLEGIGEFMPMWTHQPWISMATYMDHKIEGYDYKKITAERISRLPQGVRDAIGPYTLYNPIED